jgi:hypothetical protein
MLCHPWVVALVCLPILVDALTVAPANSVQALDLLEETANPAQALDLLEQRKIEKKKWNWKEASEESKTEWAIVLKRYVLADMTVFELDRKLGEALAAPVASDDRNEALKMARAKLARLQGSFEKAILDQNTSDATALDMQQQRKSNLLTVHEKRILAEEHKREQYGFFAIEASAQDVLQKANDIFQALDATPDQPNKTSPSWSSIVAAPADAVTPKPTYMSLLNATEAERNATEVTQKSNSTSDNTNALRGKMVAKPPTVAELSQRFEESSQTFHGDLGNFETMQRKAVTNFLSLSS